VKRINAHNERCSSSAATSGTTTAGASTSTAIAADTAATADSSAEQAAVTESTVTDSTVTGEGSLFIQLAPQPHFSKVRAVTAVSASVLSCILAIYV
jgi:hypothetical protein